MNEKYYLTDEEYNQLLDDIEKLRNGDEPVIVDGILFGIFGDGIEPPELPKPDYNYPLSHWYGQERKRFLKNTMDNDRFLFYRNTGKLQFHLIDIDKQAVEMEERLIEEYKKCEGVDDALKKRNQLEWVGRVNNIKQRVREFIQHELIFAKGENL
ncbi:MAG: TnpV protein [Clostridiales bacterium]|nr:TnpV protein [Clostridiales bacterium]